MLEKIKAYRKKRHDRTHWSNQRWYDHLMQNAMSESERNEIHAIFNRG